MRILLIEDDLNFCETLRFQLEQEAYEVDVCHDGRDGLDLFLQDAHDIVLLDRMLPTMNGLLVLQKARLAGISTPVILITALGELYDRIEGLDAGADDYLVKPFSFQELEARIKALLRRIGTETATASLRCGDLSLDPTSHRAFRNGTPIDLTVKEYRLLDYFILNQDTALNRLPLLKHVWAKDFYTNTNVVDVYVNYLRSKIDKDIDHMLIRTLAG